jgi:hypothetical protein
MCCRDEALGRMDAVAGDDDAVIGLFPGVFEEIQKVRSLWPGINAVSQCEWSQPLRRDVAMSSKLV